MKLLNLIKWDFKFQVKYGIVIAAIVVAIVWISILFFLPTNSMSIVIPIAFITDFAITGFMFFAAMLFFEKGEGTLQAIITSPIRVKDYILSKVITLTTIITAIAMAILVMINISKLININYAYALISCILSLVFFTLLGLIVSLQFESFTDVLMPMGGVFTILFLPFLRYVDSSLFDFLDYIVYIWPTYYMIRLIDGVLQPLEIKIVITSVTILLILELFMLKMAISVFNKKIIGRTCDIDE